MRTGAIVLLIAWATALAPLSAGAADEPVTPVFIDESGSAGIDSVFAGEWEYMVGGGAAVFDCNGDGMPEILLAGGSSPANFFRNTGTPGGSLGFSKQASGLELEGVAGAYPLDIDSDGKVDVILLRVGENVAMRGLGDCRFERANEAWAFDGGDAWSTAFSATWEKGALWPTAAVGNYVDRREELFPWGSCTDNWLHRPAGPEARRFAPPIALRPSHCALSMLFSDWDRSGTADLRISNDREYYKGGEEQLWRIEPGHPPARYTGGEGWQTLRIWGMGIASRDLDADGFPEYFLTSMADNKLQRLTDMPAGGPRPHYADIAFARGVTAHRPYAGGDRKPSTAWHAEFEDVNNDGLADLFIAKGNVWDMPDFARHDPNNLLIQSADGTFLEAGEDAGVASMKTARGAALADLNLDGRIDLVVVNRHDRAEIWRNATPDPGHWIQVRLNRPAPNSDAIGAWIEVRTKDRIIRREITSGGGHAGGKLGWWHFGLGSAAAAEARVLWPDGSEGPWQRLKADRFHILGQDGSARIWQPPGAR